MGILGDAPPDFTYKTVIAALIVTLLIPTMITIYCPQISESDELAAETQADLMDSYYDFTGSQASSTTQVWALRGIYTPYGADEYGNYTTSYGTTDDGWVYGGRLSNYSPSQYNSIAQENYTVTYNSDRQLYTYTTKPSGSTSIENGDIYTSVTMDVSQKSNIFFTSEQKINLGDGFYYAYTGYRYAFGPVSQYTDLNGNSVSVGNSSLSLIWYQFANSSGVAGQLILTGSDSGVSYITSQQIVSSFNNVTSTSHFTMTFNGADMEVYIKLNPYMLSSGYDVAQCYDYGYWSVMVAQDSTAADSRLSGDYSFNPSAIFDTLIALLTFDMSGYEISGPVATICSLTVTVFLYASLLAIGMSFYPVLILAGILAAIQAMASFHLF